MLKNKIIFYSISLSSFITLSSLSFFSSFFPASLHLLSSLLFLLFLLLSFSRTSTSPLFFLSFFFPFFLFYHFLFAHSPSLSLFFFFFPVTLPLCLFFSPPRPLPLRSATAVEFGLAKEFSLTDEVVAVEIWRSLILISLCFFFSSIMDSM